MKNSRDLILDFIEWLRFFSSFDHMTGENLEYFNRISKIVLTISLSRKCLFVGELLVLSQLVTICIFIDIHAIEICKRFNSIMNSQNMDGTLIPTADMTKIKQNIISGPNYFKQKSFCFFKIILFKIIWSTYYVLFNFGHIRRWDQCAVDILYSKIPTDPGLLKIRHSHRFVAVVIQILIPINELSPVPENFHRGSVHTTLEVFHRP